MNPAILSTASYPGWIVPLAMGVGIAVLTKTRRLTPRRRTATSRRAFGLDLGPVLKYYRCRLRERAARVVREMLHWFVGRGDNPSSRAAETTFARQRGFAQPHWRTGLEKRNARLAMRQPDDAYEEERTYDFLKT